MISIARYRALDMLRYQKVRQEQGIDADAGGLLEDELETMSDEQKRQIDFCMNELEAKQRQAIHLAYYCGMSHQEVTQHSDSPLGTTKSLIRRGIMLLKRCLGL
jgi:RNA polymerase sigma factor (sigma-70 family)